jgi:8-oxo-dGTP pyrophosphatase MutT (NUDIX family)
MARRRLDDAPGGNVPADDALIERIRQRLLPAPDPETGPDILPDWMPDQPFDRPPVPAAVLIALVRRDNDFAVLYTERSSALRAHSGQISFPGGRIEPSDADPAAAALREASEEVLLDPKDAEILGYMPRYFTGTNYMITPVVAVVTPSAPFVANPGEVALVFEVPLGWIADEKSFTRRHIRRRGEDHFTWEIAHGGLTIWGITANLTRSFRDLALGEEPAW